MLFALGISSCAKEELESPNQTPDPQVIIRSGENNSLDGTLRLESTDSDFSPQYINDDGDNEEEGTVVGSTNDDKDPKEK